MFLKALATGSLTMFSLNIWATQIGEFVFPPFLFLGGDGEKGGRMDLGGMRGKCGCYIV